MNTILLQRTIYIRWIYKNIKTEYIDVMIANALPPVKIKYIEPEF